MSVEATGRAAPVTASTPAAPIAAKQREIAEKRKAEFKLVFGSPELKKQFNDFLRNIFMQLDETKFDTLITSILAKNLSYEETYQELFSRIGEARHGTMKGFVEKMRSLRVIKDTLGGQIQQLLCKNAKVDGYLEYGYTGRLIRQMKKQAGIEIGGHRAVVNDKERVTDYIEAGFPRPYNQFVKLNDYAPVTPEVQPQSRDLVTCPIGLHHIPEAKVKPFLDSISDIIRPGGSFVVRDHDVCTRELDALVSVVHSVFNAATGENLQTEMAEERHFKSVANWVKIVEEHGFKYEGQKPITTLGDSTDNALFRFTKLPKDEGEELSALERTMRLTKTGYERAQEQTYMTSIEWHLVATAKEHADALKDRQVSGFPFFKHIKAIWNVFLTSCRDAIRESSLSKVAKSEYMLMNFFMLLSTTLELTFRGIAMAPLALRKKRTDDLDVGSIRQFSKISDEYAKFIKTVPFYDFPFFSKIGEMWRAFRADMKNHTLLNTYFTSVTIMELFAKGVTSAPLSWMYSGVETGNIQVIVKDPKNKVASLKDKRIEVIRASANATWKALNLPRYLEFREIMIKLARDDIQVASIAGQKKIQVKVKVKEPLGEIKGCKVLGEIPILTERDTKYLRLDIDVTELSTVLRSLEQRGVEITYLHDF